MVCKAALTIIATFCLSSAYGENTESHIETTVQVSKDVEWPSRGCVASGIQREKMIGGGQIAIHDGVVGQRSRAFMLEYIDFIIDYLKETEDLSRAIVKCQSQEKSTPECGPINDYVETYLSQVIWTARYNLAMSKVKKGRLDINENLVTPRSIDKAVAWSPLENKKTCIEVVEQGQKKQLCFNEREIVDKQLQNYRDNFFTPRPEDHGGNQEIGSPLTNLTVRLMDKGKDHEKAYLNILSQFPILQYISSLQPNRQEIVAAAQKAIKNNQDTVTSLKKLKKDIIGTETNQLFPNRSLRLLSFAPFLDSFLWKSPNHCNAAMDLLTIESRQGIVGQVVTAGLFAGSAFLPTTWFIAAAAGGSGALYTNSKRNLRDDRKMNYATVESHFETDDPQYAGFSINHVNQSLQNHRFNKYIPPFTLIGGRLTIKAVRSALGR